MTRAFQKPKRLICDLETLTPTYGHFYAQPFERGFGTTIGNALRRVLLSSIEGAAITAVKIEGVLHEFTPIPNVTEDATNIIMNLKQVPLDSVHSPIKRVNYIVEAARLGQTTDYDKLVLDVWTNGCILPQDAIAQAAKTVKDHMYIFINFEEQPEEEEEEVDRDAERMS